MRIALITEDRFYTRERALAADVPDRYFANIEREDELLRKALKGRNIEAQRVSWEDERAVWENFDCAVVRTTWNYFFRFEAFRAWLSRTKGRVRILNPPELLRWNWDKHYLQALGDAGVHVVGSRFVAPGEEVDFADELRRRPAGQLVIKPAVSGGARHTFLMTEQNRLEVERALREPRAQQTFLIQDVQRSILTRGEVSLLYFDGTFTHAVRKIAKPGDFRVQDDHGGTFVDHVPTEAERSLARDVLSALPTPATYARIDIADDNAGCPALIEAELIEPELFLRCAEHAADVFAEAIETRLREKA